MIRQNATCHIQLSWTYTRVGAPSQEKRLQKLAERVRELPVANYYTLKALIEHLRRWELAANNIII